MKRLLVTGRSGFVGTTLARMVGTEPDLADWQIADIHPDFDLLDRAATHQLIGDAAPDAVIHLAAQSNVPAAFEDPERTLRINLFGTLNLLQALKASGFRGPMLYAGTGDVYGAVAEANLPVNELLPPQPRNPYAVSKLAAEALCRQWTYTDNMTIVLARAFNHIGPGQSDQFVVSAMARQIAEIRSGIRRAEVAVGDIDVTRDFSDVRDVVRAYLALLEHGHPGEVYNVCSGTERSVRSLLEALIKLASVDVTVSTKQDRLRPAEQRRMLGDPRKLALATGWQPKMSIEKSLSDVLDYWSQKGTVHA